MLKIKHNWWLFLLAVWLAGCRGIQPSPVAVEKIRLPMGYISNVQYAPFYMAQEKGYFKDAGLDITFDYGLETNGVALVGANDTPFAVVSGEQVLMARAQGLPIVYVMAWWQDYPVGIASFNGTGILKPEDLKGKKIGIPGLFGASYVGLIALLDSAGLKESDVTLDSIGFNQVEALTAGQEQAVVIYVNNEPLQLKARGYQIDEIRVSDYVQLASNGIIANETVIAENPELVQRMVDALTRGLADVLADPQAAFEVCLKYVDGLAGLPPEEQAIQKDVLMASIEFWKAETLGLSQLGAWENMQRILLKMEFIPEKQDVTQAFTNQFVLAGNTK
jgi:NitT/TauT family transport system substrate-binding protein